MQEIEINSACLQKCLHEHARETKLNVTFRTRINLNLKTLMFDVRYCEICSQHGMIVFRYLSAFFIFEF